MKKSTSHFCSNSTLMYHAKYECCIGARNLRFVFNQIYQRKNCVKVSRHCVFLLQSHNLFLDWDQLKICHHGSCERWKNMAEGAEINNWVEHRHCTGDALSGWLDAQNGAMDDE